MNKGGYYMEHHERPDPNKEHQERECEKEKAHEWPTLQTFTMVSRRSLVTAWLSAHPYQPTVF
jgi:hypothetical protein